MGSSSRKGRWDRPLKFGERSRRTTSGGCALSGEERHTAGGADGREGFPSSENLRNTLSVY